MATSGVRSSVSLCLVAALLCPTGAALAQAPPQPSPYPPPSAYPGGPYPYPYPPYPYPYPYPYPPYPYPPPTAPPPATTAPATPPDELPYDAEKGIPVGYHKEERARGGLVTAGSIVFGVAYFPSLMVALGSSSKRARWLFIPVGGPIIALAAEPPFESDKPSQDALDALAVAALTMDIIVQFTGATLLTIGFSARKTVLVRDQATRPQESRWYVAPASLGQRGSGLVFGGAF